MSFFLRFGISYGEIGIEWPLLRQQLHARLRLDLRIAIVSYVDTIPTQKSEDPFVVVGELMVLSKIRSPSMPSLYECETDVKNGGLKGILGLWSHL